MKFGFFLCLGVLLSFKSLVFSEIAEAVGSRIPKELLTSINPILDEKGNVVYLSTVGVAQKVMELIKVNSDFLGKVAIIGFHDHVRRCVETSRNVGMDAYLPEGCKMPTIYDEFSGQPWTRNRLIYLEHELRIRIKTIAEKV